MLTRAAGSCLPRAPFPDGDRDVNNPGGILKTTTLKKLKPWRAKLRQNTHRFTSGNSLTEPRLVPLQQFRRRSPSRLVLEDRSTCAERRPVQGSAVRSGRRVVLVFRWPVGPIVLLLAERRLDRRPVIWRRRRRVVLHGRRRVIPILSSDRRAVSQTAGGSGFVG